MILPTPQQMAEVCRKNAMALRAFGEDFGHGSESAALDQAAAYIEAAAKREADHDRAIAEAVKPWRELVERAVLGHDLVAHYTHKWLADARAMLGWKP